MKSKKMIVLFLTVSAALLAACGSPSQAEFAALEQRVAELESSAAVRPASAVASEVSDAIAGAEECGPSPAVARVPFGPNSTVVARGTQYALEFANFDAAVEFALASNGISYGEEVWVAAVHTTYVGVNSGPYSVEMPNIGSPIVVLWPEAMPAESGEFEADDVYVGPLESIAVEIITDPAQLPAYVEWASCVVGDDDVYLLGPEEVPANAFLDIYDKTTVVAAE